MEITVITGPGKRSEDVWALGYRHIILPELDRSISGFRHRYAAVHAIGRVLREERPTVIFAVSLRFGLLTKLANYIYHKANSIILIPGLGFLYSSNNLLIRMSIPLLNNLMSFLLRDGMTDVVVQNADNLIFFRQRIKIDSERLHLIRGSGVQLRGSPDCNLPDGDPIVVLAGRMLWSKGVKEFVAAARIIKAKGYAVRMVLVGVPDGANPDCVPSEKLGAWAAEGIVEWWGFCDDMTSVWKSTSVAVFPTWYGEGIPKALLEAASFNRPVVATDVAGCRDVVFHNKNGLIIKPRAPDSLAEAIIKYLDDPELAKRMSLALYGSLKDTFDIRSITQDTKMLFETILSRGRPDD